MSDMPPLRPHTPANGANGNFPGRQMLSKLLNNEQFGRLEEVVNNALMARTEFFKNFGDRRRDIDSECGYPAISSFQGEQYFDLYDREPIARRVVELMPKECWQATPSVYEDDDPENITPFEEAWDMLDENLHAGAASHYKPEEGSIIWEYLCRLDEQSGIGSFGVLLLGINDGKTLEQPIDGIMSPTINSRAQGVVYKIEGGKLIVNQKTGESEAWSNENDYIKEQREHLTTNAPQGPSRLPPKKTSSKQQGTKFAQKRGGNSKPALQPDGSSKDITGTSSPSDVTKDIYGKAPGQTISSLNPYDAQNGGPLPAQHSMDTYGGALPKNQLQSIGIDTEPNQAKGQDDIGPAGSSLLGTDRQYMPIMFTPPMKGDTANKQGDGEGGQERKLIFLRVIPEHMVQVVQYEADIRNPRFGQPIMYLVTLNDPRQPHTGIGLPLATVRIHWTRLIHAADNLTSSEIFGTPRMRPVLNPILDIKKVRGAGAEGYWQSCFTALSFETHPQLGGDVAIDTNAMKDDIENFFNGLQRYLTGVGGGWKTLAPSVVDPTPHIDKSIESICIQLGVPLRVFKGAERGELASTQDDDDWNNRVKGRRSNYITPRVIVPFVDRMIDIGILPLPEEGYKIEWPDPESIGKTAKAAIAAQLTTAITTYASSGGEQVMPLAEFFTIILGLDDDTAKQIAEATQKANELEEQQQQALAEQHGMIPDIEGFQPDPSEAPITLDAGQSAVHPDDIKPGSPAHAKHAPAAGSGIPPPMIGGANGGPPGAAGKGAPPGKDSPNGPPKPPPPGAKPPPNPGAMKQQGKIQAAAKAQAQPPKPKPTANFYSIDVRDADDKLLGFIDPVTNQFCATGPGGGVDSSCSPNMSSDSKGMLDTIKGIASKIGHYEHVAKEWATDKLEKGVEKLPESLQKGVRGAVMLGKIGMAGLFAGYTAAQAFSERVAKENGLTADQARSLRGTLSKVDLGTFEVFKVATLAGVHAAHAPALFTATIPIASAGYLAYSTAKNPKATLRAATGLVRDGASKLAELTQGLADRTYHHALGLTGNASTPEEYETNANLLVAALKAHDFSDWYQALLSAALDNVGNGKDAILLADALYQKQPTMNSHLTDCEEECDDDEDCLDDCLTDNHKAVHNSAGEYIGYIDLVTHQFCATGPGGGVDPTCGKGAAGGKALAGAAKEALTEANKKVYDSIRERVLAEGKMKRGGLGVAGLKAMAKDLGIKGHTALKKEQLIKAVYDKLGVNERAHSEKTVETSKADRMHKVNLAEHGSMTFNDRVVEGVLSRSGASEKPEYQAAVRDILKNGTSAKTESVSYLKGVRNNTLNDLLSGRVTDEKLGNVLKDLSAQNHGTMTVSEFKGQEHKDYITKEGRSFSPIAPKEKEIGLAPAEKGTLWKPPAKKDLGYIERIDKPAFDRLQEITKAEKDSGKKFKDKVVDELLKDNKVALNLNPDDREKYNNLQSGGKLSQKDTRFINAFRDNIVSRVKSGDINPHQTVDALERVSDKGHGTLKLAEYHSLIGGGHIAPEVKEEKIATKRGPRTEKNLTAETVERIKKELGPELAKQVLKGTKVKDIEAEERVKAELPKEYWNKVLDKPSKKKDK